MNYGLLENSCQYFNIGGFIVIHIVGSDLSIQAKIDETPITPGKVQPQFGKDVDKKNDFAQIYNNFFASSRKREVGYNGVMIGIGQSKWTTLQDTKSFIGHDVVDA
jgi:hypothetical protein